MGEILFRKEFRLSIHRQWGTTEDIGADSDDRFHFLEDVLSPDVEAGDMRPSRSQFRVPEMERGPGMVYGSGDKARRRELYRGKPCNLSDNIGGCGGGVTKARQES